MLCQRVIGTEACCNSRHSAAWVLVVLGEGRERKRRFGLVVTFLLEELAVAAHKRRETRDVERGREVEREVERSRGRERSREREMRKKAWTRTDTNTSMVHGKLFALQHTPGKKDRVGTKAWDFEGHALTRERQGQWRWTGCSRAGS